MASPSYRWTNSKDLDFEKFYPITEAYYNSITGGAKNRSDFVAHNVTETVYDAVIAYWDGKAIGCAGLRPYSTEEEEVKRLWVEPDFRGRGLATELMKMAEAKAKEQGFRTMILQTREIMKAAVRLYEKLGYHRIENYPPYDKLDGAICFAKRDLELVPIGFVPRFSSQIRR